MSSILTSVKHALGLAEDYTLFDQDIIMHINSVFSTLQQLGVGPIEGFVILGASEEWEAYLTEPTTFNSVRSYMTLKVRMMFDPPATSYLIGAMEKQITEFEWRLNTAREVQKWISPVSAPVVI